MLYVKQFGRKRKPLGVTRMVRLTMTTRSLLRRYITSDRSGSVSRRNVPVSESTALYHLWALNLSGYRAALCPC